MSEVKAKVGVEGAGFKKGLDDLRGHARSFSNSLKGFFRDAFAMFTGNALFAMAKKGFDSLVSLFSRPVELAMNFETAMVSMEVLTGSMENARRVLEDFQKVAANTPFEDTEIIEAGKKLLAFGTSAKTVGAELMRLSDLSAGVGAPIGELAELYGKARVQGTLFAEDINQLTGRGIPVIQEFAKVLGVSTEEVKKMASEGKVTFGELEQAFENLTSKGGKFADMSAKQSGTLAGLWSTFKSELDGIMRTLGKPIVDWLKPMVTAWIAKAKELGNIVKNSINDGTTKEVFMGFMSLVGAFLGNQIIKALDKGLNFLRREGGAAARAIFGEGRKSPEAQAEIDALYKQLDEVNKMASGPERTAKQVEIGNQIAAKQSEIVDLPDDYETDALKAARDRFDALVYSKRSGVSGAAMNTAGGASGAGDSGNKDDGSGMITGVDKAKAELEAKRAKLAFEAATNEEKINILMREQASLQSLATQENVAGIEARSRLLDIEQEILEVQQDIAESKDKQMDADMKEAEKRVANSSTPDRFSGAVTRLQRIGGGGAIAGKLSDPAQREREKQTRLQEELVRVVKERKARGQEGMAE